MCAVALAGVTAVGCGGGNNADTDADLAARIDDQAAARQQEAARQQANDQPEVTEPPADETVASPPAAAGPPASSSPRLLSEADRASFSRLASQLPGDEGIAVSGVGLGRQVAHAGSLRSGVAWSTAKVPVAMAALAAGVGTQEDIRQAITASDNAAAERLWNALGGGTSAASAADAQLRAAGDDTTSIQAERLRAGFTAFGQTDWRLTDQTRFVAGMQCTEEGPAVLALMGQVVAGQRWGLGTTGTSAQFKGGWGPGIQPGHAGGWLDRQMGIIDVDGTPVAVSIATTAGDHETGTRNLTALANWVMQHVDASAASAKASC